MGKLLERPYGLSVKAHIIHKEVVVHICSKHVDYHQGHFPKFSTKLFIMNLISYDRSSSEEVSSKELFLKDFS